MVDYNTETITPFPPLPTAWDEYFPNIRIGYPAHLAQAEDESHIERRGKTSSRVLRVHLSLARPRALHIFRTTADSRRSSDLLLWRD